MEEQLRRYIEPESDQQNPYKPYAAAVEAGIVIPEHLTPKNLREPLGVMFANKEIPYDEAGLIYAGGQVWAVDHVVLLGGDKKYLHLGPSSKEDIGNHGEIRDGGLLLMTRLEDGKIKIPGGVERVRPLGLVAVKNFGLQAITGHIKDIDSREGYLKILRQAS